MKRLLMLGVLAVVCTCARAEFYIGASATTTSSEIETAVDKFESEEVGWKAFVGFEFLDFLAAEAGYRDLGNFSEGSDEGAINLDLKVIDVSARAYLPIGKIFNLFARVGYANIAWDGEVNLGDEIENFDEDDWELFYGIGSDINLGKNFAIRAEWEMYDAFEELNTLSIGLLFRF